MTGRQVDHLKDGCCPLWQWYSDLLCCALEETRSQGVFLPLLPLLTLPMGKTLSLPGHGLCGGLVRARLAGVTLDLVIGI
jgi:hypothetical protein